MDINLHKEEFSYAYIRAVATVAGCICERTTTPLDKLGIDLIITGLKEPQLENLALPNLGCWCIIVKEILEVIDS